MRREPPAARKILAERSIPDRTGLPDADACGHFKLRIACDGTWYYHGSPIGRKAITKLFASVLRREDDGTYWLVTPAERGRIEVDDAPFVAIALDVVQESGRQRLIFTTNLDHRVTVGPDYPLWLAGRCAPYDRHAAGSKHTADAKPYLRVRGGLNARIGRSVFYELAALATVEEIENGAAYGVWSDGAFFPLGPVQDRDDVGETDAAGTETSP